MRSVIVFLTLAGAVVATAVVASVVLLGSTGGDERVGHLSPVAPLASLPSRTITQQTITGDDHPSGRHHDEDD